MIEFEEFVDLTRVFKGTPYFYAELVFSAVKVKQICAELSFHINSIANSDSDDER